MSGEAVFCVRCKKMRQMMGSRQVQFANGRLALQGQCNMCGGNVMLILGNAPRGRI